MNDIEHTPGPWTQERRGQFANQYTLGAPGTGLVGYFLAAPHATTEENEANARIIAAAPELLEALELVERFMPFVPQPGLPMTPELEAREDVQAVLKTRAAIAKARGRS